MKRILFCLTLILSTSLASAHEKLPEGLNAYFNYLDQYPKTLLPLGNAQEGEIEIIIDRQKIFDIQQKTGRKVGVVAEDNYWLWINDAVKFPNGKCGVYGRLLWRQSLTGATGVAVMAMLPDGKIVLNRNFRHATRSWEYELPRGAVSIGETIEDAAAREVKEETGMILDQLQLLGQVATDSGITNAVIPVFLAKITAQQEAQPEDSEAIAAIEAFSVEELKKGFVDGYLSIRVNEEIRKIPLRDPFLAFALFQANLRFLLTEDGIH
jgi:ADP-ribose pyrophosphatase